MSPATVMRAWLAAVALLTAWPVAAVQVIDASRVEAQGKRFEVTVSLRELTRISVDNGRIANVISTDDELVIEKDPANGQVFVRPNVRADADGRYKPINAFLVTSNGNTHGLLMHVRDVPLETIVIKDLVSQTGEDRPRIGERSGLHEAAIKRVVLAVMRNEPGSEFEVTRGAVDVQLYANTRFQLVETWRGRTYQADRFVLSNVGRGELRVVEQEFFVPRADGIAIDRHVLQPGERTDVIIVRRVPR